MSLNPMGIDLKLSCHYKSNYLYNYFHCSGEVHVDFMPLMSTHLAQWLCCCSWEVMVVLSVINKLTIGGNLSFLMGIL